MGERRRPFLAIRLLIPLALILLSVPARAQTAKRDPGQEMKRQRELARQIEAVLRAGDHGACVKKTSFAVKEGAVSRQQCVHECFGTFNTAMLDALDWTKSAVRANASFPELAFVEIPCRAGRCVVSESGPFYGGTPGSDDCSSRDRNTGTQAAMTLPVLAKRADELLALVKQLP